jgi:hypothetical protein
VIPPWAFTIGRVALTPFTWGLRRIRLRIIGKQRLVEQGADAVTPAIEMAQRIGLAIVMWGTDAQIAERMTSVADEWNKQRRSLLNLCQPSSIR